MSDSEKLAQSILGNRPVKRDAKGVAVPRPTASKNGDAGHGAAKSAHDLSADSLDIICLDELPEQTHKERQARTNKSGDHLYRLLKSEKEKDLLDALKRSTVAPSADSVSKSFKIVNGQLSDATAPIGLLDKSSGTAAVAVNVAQIHCENVAIASLPKQDKVRVLMERMRTNHSELSRLEQKTGAVEKYAATGAAAPAAEHRGRDDSQSKRAIAGRSKSMSASAVNRQNLQRPHFKMSWQHGGAQKCRKPTAAGTSANMDQKLLDHNRQWDSMTKVLLSNVNADGDEAAMYANAENVDNQLIWNQSRNLAQIKGCVTSLLFERNEFGLLEICPLAMSKLKAMKTQQNDPNNLIKGSLAMPCGHSNPAACFDATAMQMMCHNAQAPALVNNKKPSHFYSTEIKELYGSMIHSGRNSCQSITAASIVQELHDSKAYDRITNACNFDWTRFVAYFNEKNGSKYGHELSAAPTKLFSNTFPSTPNTFEIGQKLEAIDPHNSGLFCVATITEKCGYRIKLQFDGYSSAYGFWANANSIDIFPAGFCGKTGRELECPNRPGGRSGGFNWEEYLKHTKSSVAHRACFEHLSTARTNLNPFKIGFKLEADDRKGTQKICVATIGDVIDSRVLISFDGFDDSFNYWTDITSPYIHAANWHQENGFSITTPPNWRNSNFNWESYLRVNRADAIPKDAFRTRNPHPFQVGMVLEVVDRKNPSMIRPAVITEIYEYDIKVLFIGWPEDYAYWIPDDSTDIYPPGWCKRTNHPIEYPLDGIYPISSNSCGIRGCMGLGNGKHMEHSTHAHLDECPYQMDNWRVENNSMLPTRIERKKSVNNWFNTGAGPCRTRVTNNPSLEKAQVSLQPFLNPVELVAMSSKDVEMFRRLQASSSFLLDNRSQMTRLHDQWSDRVPLQHVQVSASAKNPLHWDADEVAAFVAGIKHCAALDQVFVEHEIDGLAFLSLRQSDMIDIMGLSVGVAIKIYNRIVALREECNANYIVYENE